MDEFDQIMTDMNDPYDDADLAESLEPVVWLLTIYPDPAEGTPTEGWIENALLTLPEVLAVELKRVGDR